MRNNCQFLFSLLKNDILTRCEGRKEDDDERNECHTVFPRASKRPHFARLQYRPLVHTSTRTGQRGLEKAVRKGEGSALVEGGRLNGSLSESRLELRGRNVDEATRE